MKELQKAANLKLLAMNFIVADNDLKISEKSNNKVQAINLIRNLEKFKRKALAKKSSCRVQYETKFHFVPVRS